MADGRRNNGGHSTAGYAGRKTKEEKQLLVERLSPLEDDALEALKIAMNEGKPWAVRLFFAYMYGKPREMKAIHLEAEQPLINIPVVKFFD